MAESVHHIQRVDHIELLVRDMEETLVFYTDVLGFERQRHTIAERPDGSRSEQATITLDDFMMEVIQASPEAVAKEIDQRGVGVQRFALRVDDMDAAAKRLKALGVRFAQEPRPGSTFKGKRAEIVDPNGMSIELREWRDDDYRNGDWQPVNPGVRLVS